MPLIKAESFTEEFLQACDRKHWNLAQLAKASQVHHAMVYRLFNGKQESVNRKTVVKLASALDLSIRIRGDRVEFDVHGGVDPKANQPVGETDIQGVVDVLKKMNYSQIAAVEQLTRIIAMMEHHEVIDLLQVCEILEHEGNKALFLRKLKAMAEIIMPYEAVKNHGVEQKS